MPIKTLPTITVPTNNSKLLDIYRAAAIAAEVSALIAPYINRPVSWRTASSAAFDAVNILSSQGIVSSDVSIALIDSISQINGIQNTTNSLQLLTRDLTSQNFSQSIYNIESITSVLASQATSLSRSSETWSNTLDQNQSVISNSSTDLQNSIQELNNNLSFGISEISNSLSSINYLANTFNTLGVDATGTVTDVNSALNQINGVLNVVNSVSNIAINLTNTVENVKGVANNLRNVSEKLNNKRKGNKEIPKLPAAIDPRNSQYYVIYSQINSTIDSLNSITTKLDSIPKLPFLS